MTAAADFAFMQCVAGGERRERERRQERQKRKWKQGIKKQTDKQNRKMKKSKRMARRCYVEDKVKRQIKESKTEELRIMIHLVRLNNCYYSLSDPTCTDTVRRKKFTTADNHLVIIIC